MENVLPKVELGYDDALFLVPLLTSYGAWVRGSCPFPEVVEFKAAIIDNLQVRLSAIQDERKKYAGGVLLFLTTDEIDVIKGSLQCFNACAPKLLPPSEDRDVLLKHCQGMLVRVVTTFS